MAAPDRAAPPGVAYSGAPLFGSCDDSAAVTVAWFSGARNRAPRAHGDREMLPNSTPQAESLRKAIEGLIDAKLHDALARPGGLDRLLAHRRTGVASHDIRQAERRLEQTLAEVLLAGEAVGN